MRLVSPLLKRAVYPALHYSGVLGRITPAGGYAVVNYHGVVPADHLDGDGFLDGNLVRPEMFRRQIQFLKAHYQVVHPEDFRAWIEQGRRLPPRAILLTCDDGLLNGLTDMVPVLRSEGVSCLFFVTAASCNDSPCHESQCHESRGMLWYEELYLLMRSRPLSATELQLLPEEEAESPAPESFQARWWNTVKRASRLEARLRAEWMERLRSQRGPAEQSISARRWRFMNVAELKELAGHGMSIGAHTRTHPILSLCNEEEARREIQDGKNDLERALGMPIWAFAYPFGNQATMGEREVGLAREAGFTCAFLNVEHRDDGSANPFELCRMHVTLDMTLPEFSAHVSGVHARLQHAIGG
ncbi:MAG: polysaccharide deacetylase family protein [Candidatus Sulfotelmatobacter sp.]